MWNYFVIFFIFCLSDGMKELLLCLKCNGVVRSSLLLRIVGVDDFGLFIFFCSV